MLKNTTVAAIPLSGRTQGFNLFLTGFLVLFLELACIRWFAAYVIFLQFFTNVALIAAFLGMSCGCLAARSKRDWLALFPILALATVTAAFAIYVIYERWSGLAIDVGHQASPQEVFFGTEYRNPDVAQFTVPIEFVAGFFFILIALMFVGLGQVLGRAFDAFENRVAGYSLNIGGSLAGILALFRALDAAGAAAGLVPDRHCRRRLPVASGRKRSTARECWRCYWCRWSSTAPGLRAERAGMNLRWSPYYAVIPCGRPRGDLASTTSPIRP